MIAAQSTNDTAAYELYHKGRALWERRSGDNIPKAIAFFEQAIARDPNYALAYAGLSNADILLPFFAGADRREAYSKAKEAALKALRLDPNLLKRISHSAKYCSLAKSISPALCANTNARSNCSRTTRQHITGLATTR